MASVDFTLENAIKCLCGTCPVQADSVCVTEKNTKLGEAMKAGMDGMPSPANVAGLYCSTGVATCTDLDFAKQCKCAGCEVFAENGLGQWKYCERGNAATIG